MLAMNIMTLKIKNTVYNHLKKKYWSVNLTKYRLSLFAKNYTMVMKRESHTNWKTYHVWRLKTYEVKMSILHKLITDLMQLLSRSQQITFIDVDKIILKFIWKGKGNKWTKTILIKKRLKWRNQSTHYQDLFYLVTVTKTMILTEGQTYRSTEKWGPRIHKWLLTKMQKKFIRGKRAFSIKGGRTTGSMWLRGEERRRERKKFFGSLTPYTKTTELQKLTQKWITGLHLNKTIKL